MHKIKVILLLTFIFNIYCVDNSKIKINKFNWANLPQELQIKIALDAFVGLTLNDRGAFIRPEQFYNNLLRFRKTKAFWQIIKNLIQRVYNNIDLQDSENTKNLYFPGNVLNIRFPHPILTQALVCAVRCNALETAEILLLLGANSKVWDPTIREPIINLTKHRYGSDSPFANMLRHFGAKENVPYDWADEGIINKVWGRDGINKIKKYIVNGANLNITQALGTALTLCVRLGEWKIAEELISAGIDVNAKDIFRKTVLMNAASYSNIEIIKFLVGSSANVNEKGLFNGTALLIAVSRGNMEIIKFLISSGADINAKDINETVLTIATHKRNLKAVKFLISAGANINDEDVLGNTALKIALDENYLEIAEFLLLSGANVYPDWFDFSAVRIIDKDKIVKIMELIKEHSGVDINSLDRWQRTPLMRSVQEGKLAKVIFLISIGADVNIKNSWGDTALFLAIKEGHLKIVKFLISIGADVYPQGRFYNALDVARSYQRDEIVKVLEEHIGKCAIL